MAADWLRSLAGGGSTPDSRLAWAVLWGTVPVGLAGLAFQDLIANHLRLPLVIVATTIGFGLLLWWGDLCGKRCRDEHSLRWWDVVVIGCAQALALIPGTSRSGVTITAGLALGLTRPAAARFSFLLSIPVIVLAGGAETAELLQSPGPVDWRALLLGAALSGVSAYLCIHLFLRLLQHIGMWPFILYRLALGAYLFHVFG
jgi:undecaprenyl-diphosphatase